MENFVVDESRRRLAFKLNLDGTVIQPLDGQTEKVRCHAVNCDEPVCYKITYPDWVRRDVAAVLGTSVPYGYLCQSHYQKRPKEHEEMGYVTWK